MSLLLSSFFFLLLAPYYRFYSLLLSLFLNFPALFLLMQYFDNIISYSMLCKIIMTIKYLNFIFSYQSAWMLLEITFLLHGRIGTDLLIFISNAIISLFGVCSLYITVLVALIKQKSFHSIIPSFLWETFNIAVWRVFLHADFNPPYFPFHWNIAGDADVIVLVMVLHWH